MPFLGEKSQNRVFIGMWHASGAYAWLKFLLLCHWCRVGWNCMISMHSFQRWISFPWAREQLSERANKWVHRCARPMRSKQMSERCERADEQMAQYSTCQFHSHYTQCMMLLGATNKGKVRRGTHGQRLNWKMVLNAIVRWVRPLRVWNSFFS